jgi:uncharacterized protein (DUF58 family)
MSSSADNASKTTATDAAQPWRARLRRWMRPPRRLAFTTSGKFFVALTIGIGFGAINTGNNLLFLLLGMMLSLILASGVLSEAVIRALKAKRSAPKRIFADTPAPGAFSLQNPSRWPSLSIEVCEQNITGLTGPLRGKELGPKRVPWWKFWRFRNREKTDYGTPVAQTYTLRIEGGERYNLEARYLVPRRGRYRLSGLDIVTRFPFGLFEKRRELDQADELLVYPAPVAVEDWFTSVHARFGDAPQNERGSGEEYFGLRDYREGEDQRMIHWKSSARRGEVVVRETEAREQRAVEVCLLNCTGEPAQGRHLVEGDFEVGLRCVVGLLMELLKRGYRVGLRTLDDHVPAADETSHLDRMLSKLAVSEVRDGMHAMELPEPSATDSVGRILVGLSSATQSAGAGFDLVLDFEGINQTTHLDEFSEFAEAAP